MSDIHLHFPGPDSSGRRPPPGPTSRPAAPPQDGNATQLLILTIEEAAFHLTDSGLFTAAGKKAITFIRFMSVFGLMTLFGIE